MSFSDGEAEVDPEAEAEDKKLEDLWVKKSRRRSSTLKILVGDKLELKENPKVVPHLAKNGECVHSSQEHGKMVYFKGLQTHGSFLFCFVFASINT